MATSISTFNNRNGQKTDKEIKDLTKAVSQLEWLSIYSTHHTKEKPASMFSIPMSFSVRYEKAYTPYKGSSYTKYVV